LAEPRLRRRCGHAAVGGASDPRESQRRYVRRLLRREPPAPRRPIPSRSLAGTSRRARAVRRVPAPRARSAARRRWRGRGTMTDWKSALRSDPTPWLLENACVPIRYRVLTELLDRPKDDPDVQKARAELLVYPPALKLQRTQRKDGTWGGNVHAGDARKF